ncbi:hypothetical protein [Lacrimispora sp.]|uniref:hypothetical protein n=1 Tax=Lacrimispora sp. TaxID=2719234 RepID=UPI0029DEEC84|nr:5-methylcytosine-specific restriction enzyme [Lacrimispora sp.]
MATSTEIIRDYINKNIKELDREIISKEETYVNNFDKRNVDVVRTETGEDVIISYSDISITGTDRAKPQIRVFMDKQKNVYENARMRKMRYFLLTIFSKDNAMAKNINNFDPHDFIVAIETNVDNENSRRDLRSLYDYLDEYIKENGDVDYLRCTQGQHQSGIYQASFIRIKKDGIDTPIFLKNYITYFDNRPYMNSIDETIGVEEKERINEQYNRIVFGAPGTGKSHRLDEDSKSFGSNMERVTFHPNYAYSQFVGTYKPVMEIREGKKEISYQYIPGPFMRVFLKAQKSILINREYKDLENVNVYYEPATSMEHWNLFEEIQKEGDIESFKATKDMKKGDIALVYIGNNSFGYDNGIYAIAKVISNPEIDESEEDGALRVTLRFDKISYDKPIISKEKLDEYNTQYQSVHRIDNAKQLIQEISFAVEDELLLIEEINRANVAAVFGDVFQLLDRKNGISEYSIATSEDLKNYLDEELWMYDVDNTEIRIPSNMFIWATMNSADQGVFPMDTAFKRRWEFEYIGIDEEEDEVTEYVIPIGIGENRKYVYWNELRKKINSILSQEENRINEDKLLGPFFISKSVLENALINEEAEDNFVKTFESKVIMYLFEDVMKMRPEKIFPGCKERKLFSKICEAFETDGEKIFGINDLQYIEKTLQE